MTHDMTHDAPTFRLYNTMTREREAFAPADPSHVTFYTCGPTVYDDAHIGNFRSFLAADLLRRWLESPLCTIAAPDGSPHAGPRRVTHVMNITDVGHMTDDDSADGGGEDKMAKAGERLLEAKKAGTVHSDAEIDPRDPRAIASFYAERFIEDATRLGMRVAIEAGESEKARRTLMPRATEHVDGMKRVIASLVERGFAYAAGEKGARAVYFDVQAYSAYGELSGNTLDKLRGGAGGRVDDATQSEKKHPADFLLWKEDASHLMKWASADLGEGFGDWGEGYPGWHIECTAMSLARLVPGELDAAQAKHAEIDLHSGGEDNIFPHHECERAQSCAFTGAARFARHWFHPRFLMVDGGKMSKSKGTFYTPRELFAKGIEPAALRLALIGGHYRSNLDFSMQALKDAQRQIDRWRRITREIMLDVQDNRTDVIRPYADRLRRFAEALSDDLNIAGALSMMSPESKGDYSEYAEEEAQREERTRAVELPDKPMDPRKAHEQLLAPGSSAERSLAALHLIDNILGVIFQPAEESQSFEIGVFLPGVEASPEVESLLIERRDAKKSKDFARADAIRDELAGRGLAIKDVAGGRVEVGPA